MLNPKHPNKPDQSPILWSRYGLGFRVLGLIVQGYRVILEYIGYRDIRENQTEKYMENEI